MPIVVRCSPEEIDPNWKFQVCRVEIYNVLNAMTRYVIKQIRSQIAVRINDANAMPGCYVLDDEVVQERRLAGSAFPDGVKMMPPVMRP